jgi:hypothetical protein
MDTIDDRLVATALRHAAAEAAHDMDGALGTLEGEPVYELFPVGLRMTGMDRARRYYSHYFAEVAPRIINFTLIGEWVNRSGVLQEYDITYRQDDGVTRDFRILGILTFGDAALSGERIYADAEILRIMFAPLWDELTPCGQPGA